MEISKQIDTNIKNKLINWGEEIFEIWNWDYLQVISDLNKNIFKILYLSNTKPVLKVDNVVNNSIFLSKQTQEVVDENKYMISIIERLSDNHYTKFTHIDYRWEWIMSYLLDVMEDFKPIKSEWTDRLSVYKFLLHKWFNISHVMNFPNLIWFCDDKMLEKLEQMDKNKVEKLPYRMYMKKNN